MIDFDVRKNVFSPDGSGILFPVSLREKDTADSRNSFK